MSDYLPIPVGVSLEDTWLVDRTAVNIDHLVQAKPGSIILMNHPDAIKYIPPAFVYYEHIAGVISDAA
jgi:hypothetical protein